MAPPREALRQARERDLLYRLLTVSRVDDVRAFLRESLSLLAEATGAVRGYLELEHDDPAGLSVARGLDAEELAGIRQRLSRGIIFDALRTGRIINTASASDDPRYMGRDSVKSGRICAVLCAPLLPCAPPPREGDIGASAIGTLYLEGRSGPGPFSKDDEALIALAASHLGPLAERLLVREQRDKEGDPTLVFRRKLAVSDIAGHSVALAKVFEQISVAAAVSVTVLMRGESGTGKTALARALHLASPRGKGPFVELNVAALPDALLESELFGAEKGAHSTAQTRIIGKAEVADGGTLFLDEIGELSLAAQAKLLGFLQSRRFMRLGGTEVVSPDLRIVAATHVDLEEAVREKRFREDLYYRLNVLEIVVPPLRERSEDIPQIATAILDKLCQTADQQFTLSRAARSALSEGEWSGNVRQLENVITRGWARAQGEATHVLTPHHLFPDRPSTATDGAEEESYEEATRRFQRGLLERTLRANQWNVSAAARSLSLSRSRINELIRAHGLVREAPP